MNIFLIDYENVQSQGLMGILTLSAKDIVYVFYSAKDKLSFEILEQITKTEATIKYLKSSVGGKNALDHQLSGYLGYLIGSTDCKEYYIVSKDKGYQYIMSFWQEQNINVSITTISSIKEAKSTSVKKVTTTKSSVSTEIKAITTKPILDAKNKATPIKPKSIATKKTSTHTAKTTATSSDASKTENIIHENNNEQKYVGPEEIINIVPEAASKDWLNDIVGFINTADNKAQLYQKIRRRLGQDKGSKVYNAVKKLY